MDSESYLVEVARYIVLNPVRAHMVASAGDWPWSSYRATAGLTPVPGWLDPFPVLERFHPSSRELAAAEYRKFVTAAAAQTHSPWENLVAQSFLGSTEFLRKVEERIRLHVWSREYPKDQRKFRSATLESVRLAVEHVGSGNWPPPRRSDARMAFAWLADRQTNATRAEIGRCLDMSGQGAGHLIRTAESRLGTNCRLDLVVNQAQARLRLTALPDPF